MLTWRKVGRQWITSYVFGQVVEQIQTLISFDASVDLSETCGEIGRQRERQRDNRYIKRLAARSTKHEAVAHVAR